MAVGTGIDVHNGVGRSALDDRILTRSEFHNIGIVMGCKVTGSASAMAYTVSPGTDPVSVAVGSRGPLEGATKFQVPTASVSTTAGPASGSRVDIVWARQNDPTKGDANNLAVLGVTQGVPGASAATPTVPVGAVPLAYVVVPAGASRASQCEITGLGDRAVPYGTGLGVLHRHVDSRNSTLPDAVAVLGPGRIVLPTPRQVEFRLSVSLMPTTAGGNGSAFYRIVTNGLDRASFVCAYDDATTQTYIWTDAHMPAGAHTVAYKRLKKAGSAARGLHGSYQGEIYQGTVFEVIDLGVA